MKDYNVEGKTIKEINQGISYCYIYFTDGSCLDLDVKGNAYINYKFQEQHDQF